jgi:hypothetical protein
MKAAKVCHRVSAYTRVRFGRVEYVCSHWRCCS